MGNKFEGPVVLLGRNDINTDEIIPAKYLTEITKLALKPHLLEDLELDGFDPQSERLKNAKVVVQRISPDWCSVGHFQFIIFQFEQDLF